MSILTATGVSGRSSPVATPVFANENPELVPETYMLFTSSTEKEIPLPVPDFKHPLRVSGYITYDAMERLKCALDKCLRALVENNVILEKFSLELKEILGKPLCTILKDGCALESLYGFSYPQGAYSIVKHDGKAVRLNRPANGTINLARLSSLLLQSSFVLEPYLYGYVAEIFNNAYLLLHNGFSPDICANLGSLFSRGFPDCTAEELGCVMSRIRASEIYSASFELAHSTPMCNSFETMIATHPYIPRNINARNKPFVDSLEAIRASMNMGLLPRNRVSAKNIAERRYARLAFELLVASLYAQPVATQEAIKVGALSCRLIRFLKITNDSRSRFATSIELKTQSKTDKFPSNCLVLHVDNLEFGLPLLGAFDFAGNPCVLAPASPENLKMLCQLYGITLWDGLTPVRDQLSWMVKPWQTTAQLQLEAYLKNIGLQLGLSYSNFKPSNDIEKKELEHWGPQSPYSVPATGAFSYNGIVNLLDYVNGAEHEQCLDIPAIARMHKLF